MIFDFFFFFLLSRERLRHLKHLSRQFLVEKSQQHRSILTRMGQENFSVEPYFSNLRNNMRELVEVLAAVAAGVPQSNYGFYRSGTRTVRRIFCACHPFVADCVIPVTQGTAFNRRHPGAIPCQVFTSFSS